jgi:hypothetical protein
MYESISCFWLCVLRCNQSAVQVLSRYDLVSMGWQSDARSHAAWAVVQASSPGPEAKLRLLLDKRFEYDLIRLLYVCSIGCTHQDITDLHRRRRRCTGGACRETCCSSRRTSAPHEIDASLFHANDSYSIAQTPGYCICYAIGVRSMWIITSWPQNISNTSCWCCSFRLLVLASIFLCESHAEFVTKHLPAKYCIAVNVVSAGLCFPHPCDVQEVAVQRMVNMLDQDLHSLMGLYIALYAI